MLVLSRQKDEKIVIGEKGDIRITIVDVRGDKVRLGIEAPKKTPVHRIEVFEAIQREKKEKGGNQNGLPERKTTNQETSGCHS